MVDSRKIAILGAGRIGEALSPGSSPPAGENPRRSQRPGDAPSESPSCATGTASTRRSRTTTPSAGASLVVIAVKPQDIEALLGEIGGLLLPEQTVLSIAAAIPTARIEARLSSGVPVVRAMPNTPSTVHEGIAGLCAGAHAGDEHLDLAEEALSHLGAVVRVPESSMDAITAVSGSGPAYFALLAEAMIEAGILLGLSREISTQLVVQTMLGHREAAPRREDAPGRAARDGHLPGRDDDRGDQGARDGGRPSGFPQRDPGGDGPRHASSRPASTSARQEPEGGDASATVDPAGRGEHSEARARCRATGMSSRNSSRHFEVGEQRPDRLLVAACVAGRQAQRACRPRSRGSRRGPWRVAASSSASASSPSTRCASAAAYRPIGLSDSAAPASSAHSASSTSALDVACDQPRLHRPDRPAPAPAGASGQLSR